MQKVYDKFVSVKEIFNKFGSGTQTHRDEFLVGFTSNEVEQKMIIFTSDLPDETVKESLNLKDTRDWKFKTAREKVKKIDWRNYIRRYAYRPFDVRYICYLSALFDRGADRYNLMQNFFNVNSGLATTRLLSSEKFLHVAVTSNIADKCFVSNKGKESSYVFPLYLYTSSNSSSDKNEMFGGIKDVVTKTPNIKPELFDRLSQSYGKSLTPEQIFYYIYAVLYSNIYRAKYAEFLKIDFPKIPFTSDYEIFNSMAEFGKQLIELHLLSSSELSNPISKFRGQGSSVVEKVRYDPEERRVYINNDNYFDNVEQEVFNYQIGAYQVCDKWLKDRKGRTLSLSETIQYSKIVTAISKTIQLQTQIDSLYEKLDKEFEEEK
jgi:predicted helicase